MANLKNINFMSKTRFDSTTTSDEELYLVDYGDIDFVVESYTNGTNWYRIYKSGWCEQGGRGALNEAATTTITLLKPYKDTNYFVSAVSITESTATDTEVGLQCTPKSTTQITLTAHHLNPNNQTACWEAKGYMA